MGCCYISGQVTQSTVSEWLCARQEKNGVGALIVRIT